ncbi:MAG: transglycosylase domain-containing protein, partial [Angelakisella sp.]
LQRLEGDAGSRVWVDYENMPPQLFDTLIAVEDKRFKEHQGVDWLGTTNSFVKLVLGKFGIGSEDDVRGASTITQQLVRNITNDKENSIPRKLREIFRALKLEKYYSKDQILESYLNTVPFGNNTNGIQAAANLYFSKDASDLNVSEMASIIGITKSPTYYNPYYTKDNNKEHVEGFKNNQKRKEDILFLMHEQNKLTDAEYKDALAYEVVFDTANNDRRVQGQQSYFVDYLMEQVISDLSATKGITRQEAQGQLYNGGFRIYSTVDPVVQGKVEKIYENPSEYMPKVSNKDEYPQSAFIITDPSGAIKGLVGGTGKKEGARIWNRATDTKRQPGSTIKPISSYALAFENDLVTWSSLLMDGPYSLKIEDQPPWQPKDYYGAPKGYMILEEALQRSCNLIPVRLVATLSPKTVWSFLHDTLGMTSLEDTDKAPSPMSLGALTQGVTPIEMAGAYQMYTNGGTYTPPYTYTKVLDSKGNVVLERNIAPTRVITFDTATIVNKLMQRVVTGPYGTGSRASLAKTNPGIPVAGKTGTTDDDVDQWFVGLTPYYVGICWMGFDDQILMTEDANGNKTPVRDGAGQTVPHSIGYKGVPYPPPLLWKTVMSSVHEGLEAKSFPTSSNVVSLTYCLDTGYAATTLCEHTSTGWYKTTNVPTLCPMHSAELSDVPYHVAGEKPWLGEFAPYSPEWAFLYPNVKPEFDEDGNPIVPSIENE